MSDVIISANASGTASVTLSAPAVNSAVSLNLPNQTGNIGYSNIPNVGTVTTAYTLAVGDVGKFVIVNTGGSIVCPTSVFAAGDCILVYNNTTGNITITCSAPTAYVAGANTVVTSSTLATRGVASILYYSATACVIFGNAT
jgi:hypothetical protein